jgi:hypothetical protein
MIGKMIFYVILTEMVRLMRNNSNVVHMRNYKSG